MFAKRTIWIRILAGILLVAVLAAAGFFVFRAGQASGIAISQSQGADGRGPALSTPFAMRGLAHPLAHRHFFPGFGLFFLCLAPILFFLLAGSLFRWAVWGPRWHAHGPHPWHGYGPYPQQAQPPTGGPAQPAQSPPPEPPSSGQPQ